MSTIQDVAAFFNEIEPYPAQWMRNLMAAGHIAPGVVDERSIKTLTPDDVRHATQAHFFAGIGVWSHALRSAGWPDDRPVWTGSCPCQPFSSAGKRAGTADERHLWPDWFELIRECRPPVVLGEQVASKDGLAWLDAVQADLEGAGYAFASFDLCAAGFGAPHVRQRLYFAAIRLADADGAQLDWSQRITLASRAWRIAGPSNGRATRGLADDGSEGRRQVGENAGGSGGGSPAQGVDERPMHMRALDSRGLGNADSDRTRGRARASTGAEAEDKRSGLFDRRVGNVPGASGPDGWLGEPNQPRLEGHGQPRELNDQEGRQDAQRHGPTSGVWSNPDWLPCRDGKWRPVEPGTFPLAHGAPARVGRLRAYGNAIVAPQAVEFIRAVMEFLQ